MKHLSILISLGISCTAFCTVQNPDKAHLPTVHIVQINNNTHDGFVFNKLLEPSQAKFQHMYIAQEGKIAIPKKQRVQNPNFGTVYFDYNYGRTEGTSKRSLIDTVKGTIYKLHVAQTLKYDEEKMKIIGKSVVVTLTDDAGHPVARMGTALPPTQFKENRVYIAITLNSPINTSKIALVSAIAREALPTTAVDY